MNAVVIIRKRSGAYRCNGKQYMARAQAINSAAKLLLAQRVEVTETFDVSSETATIIVKRAA